MVLKIGKKSKGGPKDKILRILFPVFKNHREDQRITCLMPVGYLEKAFKI
jgi:hypothetical protein